MSSIVLGVAGGIAAYKAVELLRLLRESGLDVTVVPTQAALRFVGEPTWAALSGQPVSSSVWSGTHEVRHVRLGQEAELVVVAPATADVLARAARGIADDLLANVLLTARCPVLMAPAMHTEMWEHPATRANVAILRERGVIVLEPDSGRLTGSDSGPGRLPDPARIADAVHELLRRRPSPDLQGIRILISAGGTREPWDPVRFLGNASSGKQGVALARTAIARGAQVTVVAAAMDLDPPAGAQVIRVGTAAELEQVMQREVHTADVVVMAAAVADFRPSDPAATKVRKETSPEHVTLHLERNPDILAGLVAARSGARPLLVGFAAETAESPAALEELAHAKLVRKGCDLLVANDVGAAEVFGADHNAALILRRDAATGKSATVAKVERSTKAAVADAVWDAVVAVLAESSGRP